uniref:Uncharacterized protein n=1 Tax=Anopheles melas TaxID=34690 RepID=A0A182TF88_9DIPT
MAQDLTVGHSPRTEQSAWELCTQPESSLRMQQAVSRSCLRVFDMRSMIRPSLRMQGAYFDPRSQTSDQHLAALLLEPNANRADPVAQQRQQQHQYLRRVDPVRKVRPVVVPVVQRVRPQQLDAVARRTPRVVQHALQYRARYALAVEELKHGVVAPGRNVLQMQLLLGRARPPPAGHERPVRLEHVDLVRIVRHWRTGQILLLLGRWDTTARTVLTTTRRHIEKHLILLHRHIVIVIVEGDVRRGEAAGPLLLPARHPVSQALHHKHQPAEHHARHGRFPLDQKLFAALVPYGLKRCRRFCSVSGSSWLWAGSTSGRSLCVRWSCMTSALGSDGPRPFGGSSSLSEPKRRMANRFCRSSHFCCS